MGGICYNIVPLYFDRWLGLANAGLNAGACVGQIAVAPFIRYLLDQYGFKGGTLVFGAFVMNAFVGVSLFHPLKWHMEVFHPKHTNVPLSTKCRSLEGLVKSTPVNLSEVTVRRNSKETSTLHQEDDIKNVHNWNSMASIHATFGNFAPICDSYHSDNIKKLNHSSFSLIKRLSAIFVRIGKATISDMGILQLRRAKIIVISGAISICSYNSFLLLMPLAVQAKGHSLEDTAWIMSVIGTSNIAARFTVSPLSDWKWFDQRICLMFGYALNGSALIGMKKKQMFVFFYGKQMEF